MRGFPLPVYTASLLTRVLSLWCVRVCSLCVLSLYVPVCVCVCLCVCLCAHARPSRYESDVASRARQSTQTMMIMGLLEEWGLENDRRRAERDMQV